MPEFRKLFESAPGHRLPDTMPAQKYDIRRPESKWKGIWWIKFEDSRPMKMKYPPQFAAISRSLMLPESPLVSVSCL
jgi:hypothetical protein